MDMEGRATAGSGVETRYRRGGEEDVDRRGKVED